MTDVLTVSELMAAAAAAQTRALARRRRAAALAVDAAAIVVRTRQLTAGRSKDSRVLRSSARYVPECVTYAGGRDVPDCAPMLTDAADRKQRAALVGANLRRYREAAGLSQSKLAAQLGMPRHHISRWEHGVHEPQPAALTKLGLLLGRRWQDFYEDEHA